MKRWQWVSLVVVAGLAAAVIAVLPFRGVGNTSRTLAQQAPKLELDMVQDAGGTWCNPVDSSATHAQGATYHVAVCLTDASLSPGGFQFDLNYDAQLNDCVDSTDANFDSNPDANLGVTKFSGTQSAPDGLGASGWNCNLGGVAPPTCANLSGNAFLQCNTVSVPGTLPVGQNVSEPIAVLEFTALFGGVDNLTLENVEVDDNDTNPYISCFPSDPEVCIGATDTKGGPTNTPAPPTSTPAPATATTEVCGPNARFTCAPTPRAFTATPTPGPTGTSVPPTEGPPPPPPPPPAGGQGPSVIPPATGEGPGMPWGAPITAIIVGLAAVSLISSGLFVRFAGKR